MREPCRGAVMEMSYFLICVVIRKDVHFAKIHWAVRFWFLHFSVCMLHFDKLITHVLTERSPQFREVKINSILALWDNKRKFSDRSSKCTIYTHTHTHTCLHLSHAQKKHLGHLLWAKPHPLSSGYFLAAHSCHPEFHFHWQHRETSQLGDGGWVNLDGMMCKSEIQFQPTIWSMECEDIRTMKLSSS